MELYGILSKKTPTNDTSCYWEVREHPMLIVPHYWWQDGLDFPLNERSQVRFQCLSTRLHTNMFLLMTSIYVLVIAGIFMYMKYQITAKSPDSFINFFDENVNSQLNKQSKPTHCALSLSLLVLLV